MTTDLRTLDRKRQKAAAREQKRRAECFDGLVAALQPFDAFLAVYETMGRNIAHEGEIYEARSSAGSASITVEMLQAVRKALSRARRKS